MLRNRAVAILLCCLASRLAFALGLGPLEATSALNEPFTGRIEVLGAKSEDFDTLTIALAGEEQFRRAGIERPAVLFQLHFSVADSPDGKDYISITSRDSIREPFLNFLLEMNWANGRLLREYTVLLDPPLYDPNRRLAAAPAVPRTASVARPSYVPATKPVLASATQPTTSRAVAPSGAVASAPNGDIGPVGAGDTLWSLARSYRQDDGVAIQQMMLAILRQNPDAFSRGNVNMLRRGAVLHMPDDAAMRSMSARQAAAEVHHQHQLWEEYRQHASAAPTAQPLGTPSTPATAAEPVAVPTIIDPNARLELVAPGGSAAGAASGKAGKPGAAGAASGDAKLVRDETLDATTRQAGDLKDRLSEAEEIINILQRQVNIKDQELASLQARLAELGVKQGDLGASAAAAQASATGAQPAQTPATTGAEAVPAVSPETAVVEAPPEAAGETSAAAPESEPEIDIDTAPPSSQPGFPASLVPPGIAKLVPGGALGVIGLLVLAVLGIGAIIARTALKPSGEAAEPVAVPLRTPSSPVASEDLTQGASTAHAGDDDRTQTPTNFDPLATETSLPAFDPNATVDAAAAAPGQPGSQGSDPLEEVNVYLAYERFDQAEELVKRVIAQYPGRHDYKLRLLEVYYSSNDRVSYENAARELHNAVGDSDPLWESALAMWAEMSPDRALFAAGGALAATLLPASASAFVDITGDSDADAIEATLTHAPRPGESTLDFDLVGETTGTSSDTSNFLDLTAAEGGTGGEILDLTSTAELAETGEMGSVFDLTANNDDASFEIGASGVFDLTEGVGDSNELLDITGGGEGSASSGDFLDLSGGGSDLLDVSKTGDVSMVDDLDLLNVTASGLSSVAPSVEADAGAELGNAPSSLTTASFDISDTVAPVFNKPDADDDILDITGGNLASGADDELEFDIGGLDIEEHPTVEMELPALVKATGLDLSAGGDLASSLDFDIAASDDELSGAFDISESEYADGDLEITMSSNKPFDGELSLKGEELDAIVLDGEDDLVLGGDLDFELDDTTELDAIAGDETLDMATAIASRPVRTPRRDDDAMSLDDLTLELDGALGNGRNGEHLETLALEIESDDMLDLGASQTIVMPVDHTIERQSAADEADTKLNLAKAYVELGDSAGARSILEEVAVEGTPAQQTEAKTLIGRLKA